MNWMTKEEVKKAAKGTLLEALECSREHHRQGAECEHEELVQYSTVCSRPFIHFEDWTSCVRIEAKVIKGRGCPKCPLDNNCCFHKDLVYKNLNRICEKFYYDRSRANFKSFQEAEHKMVAKLDELIKAEKAKLAEEAKPKLRDGDYGPDKDGQSSVALAHGGGEFYYYQSGVNSNNPAYAPVIILGNIFDDLKALQEDVALYTEFPYKDSHGDEMQILMDSSSVHFRGNNGMVYNLKEISAIILKLRQMEAKLKRQK